jgi:hypothetical protein
MIKDQTAAKSSIQTAANDLMKDAMAGYLQELTEAREMLDGRCDDIKSGRVTAKLSLTACASTKMNYSRSAT